MNALLDFRVHRGSAESEGPNPSASASTLPQSR